MNAKSNGQQTVKYSIGFDIGTHKSAMSMMTEGRLVPIKFPFGGSVVPSAVFFDEDGSVFVGNEAEMRAWKNPTRFYSHFKPHLATTPDEPFHGGPTCVELTSQVMKYMTSQMLVKMPELVEFPQFGGSGRPAKDLALCFTVPAGWGIPEQDAMLRAIVKAGINADLGENGFIAEPKAGCRRILHEFSSRVADGHKILCVDPGGGTTDVIFLRKRKSGFDEISPPLGDQFLGGRLFSAALAALLSQRLAGACGAAFSLEDGLRLDLVEDSDREFALNIWQAAEEAKLRLSTADQAAVFVQTPEGKRELVVKLDDAQQAWRPLWERLEVTISSSMREAGIRGAEIDHVYLIGGSALLPTMRRRIAALTERAESQVLVSEDSAHVVANGAAEEAYYREESDHVLIGGIGLRMQDELGNAVNRMYLRPNHIVPAGGMQVEQMGQRWRSPGGETTLWLEPVIAKPGVRCAVPLLGLTVLLEDCEVVRLKELTPKIDLPQGDHEVRLGISIDVNRATHLVITPTSLPDCEPIVVELAMGERQVAADAMAAGIEIVLLFDCSSSMKGEKLIQARRAIRRFVKDVARHNPRLALIRFGGCGESDEKAAVLTPFTADTTAFATSLEVLQVGGGTFLAEGLELGRKLLATGLPNWVKMAVVFSDGMPQCVSTALAQAELLKHVARVMCVGIGKDAFRPTLEQISSMEGDYFEAQTPSRILDCLFEVAELVHQSLAQHETFSARSA